MIYTPTNRTLNNQNNAIRLSSIILDIGAKVFRAHIQYYMELNNYKNVSELINDSRIVNEKMRKNLEKRCFGNIPNSLDESDITKSFALINNVINELYKKSKFKYDSKQYDCCYTLKEIRNKKYAHVLAFEIDDVDFCVTVVTIQEVIRQLCHFDEEISKKYLEEVEVELEKDSSQLNKYDVIKLLAEQKEELQTFIGGLVNSLSHSTDSTVQLFCTQLTEFISTEVVQLQKDLFIQLIDTMRKYEESRSLLFQLDVNDFHEQTETIKQIDSKTSRIESKLDTIINKPDKPQVSEIQLASNLPPPASKLFNRENEREIFAELAKYKLTCIAGMAGVGKSTLAITYGYYRKEHHEAKVFIFLDHLKAVLKARILIL